MNVLLHNLALDNEKICRLGERCTVAATYSRTNREHTTEPFSNAVSRMQEPVKAVWEISRVASRQIESQERKNGNDQSSEGTSDC